MLALEILVNGKKYVIAGAEDWSGLHANLLAYRSEDRTQIQLDAGAHLQQVKQGELHAVRWRIQKLSVGDEVTIRIIESNTVDEPDKRYRNDATVQESPFTEEEMMEFQRQEYERLKKVFEPSGSDR